jgi:hypothetical protein
MIAGIADYLGSAICPSALIAFAVIGGWLLKLGFVRHRQFLVLMGLGVVGWAISISIAVVPKLIAHNEVLVRWLQGPETGSSVVLFISFLSTICFWWATGLMLLKQFEIHETGRLVEWIVAAGTVALLAWTPEARAACKVLDTGTSVLAYLLLSVAMATIEPQTVKLRNLTLLRASGAVLWGILALRELPWHLIDEPWFKEQFLGEANLDILNALGIACGIAATLIVGKIGKHIIPNRRHIRFKVRARLTSTERTAR